jgi:DNA-binding ferritin-like protein (Dps family)
MAIMENYSTWVSGVYDNYIVCTFKWTYRHVDLQNEALFNRVLEILEEGEHAIKVLGGDKAEYFSKHLANVKVTFLHMKINKVHHHLFSNIEKCGVTQFAGLSEIPPVKKQGFYNVEMVHNVKVPVIIPDDVKKQIDELDVYSISDKLDLENAPNIGKLIDKKFGKPIIDDIDTVI